MAEKYNFGPAAPNENIVYGACRPSYSWYTSAESTVADWIEFMCEHEIERVCCLLDAGEITEYYGELISTYQTTFGNHCVCHVSIEDQDIISRQHLHKTVFPFLLAGLNADERTVVHCSAGQGRTGHVLALWLSYARNYEMEEAVRTVQKMGRAPLEAKAATIERLRNLLTHPDDMNTDSNQ